MKLFTKDIDKQLFAQYPKGSDLETQMVVAKIFNPYGNGRWYLLNSDPNDSDYIWAIVQMGDIVEMGSVSRKMLESMRLTQFNMPLERDMSFQMINAQELFSGLREGKFYKKGGWVAKDDNSKMLHSNTKSISHHAKEIENTAKGKDIEAWVVAKSERAATDLSDITHYLDGKEYAEGGYMSLGGDVKKTEYLAGVAEERILENANLFEKGNVNKNNIIELLNAGYYIDDLVLMYFGATSYEGKEILGINNTRSLSCDYVSPLLISEKYDNYTQDNVDAIVRAAKRGLFDIGLKYPTDIDWENIMAEYDIDEDPMEIVIRDEKYLVYAGRDVFISTYLSDWQKEEKKQSAKKDSFLPYYIQAYPIGYCGIVCKSKDIMYDIAKRILTQKDGYVKKMDLFHNGLGGIQGAEVRLIVGKKDKLFKSSKSLAGGGLADDISKLNGRLYNIYAMGVNEPTVSKIEEARVTDAKFAKRDVIIKSSGGGEDRFPLDKLQAFMNGESVRVHDGKEYYEIELIKNNSDRMSDGGYMAEGGNVKKQEWVAVYVNQEKPSERKIIQAFGDTKEEATKNARMSEGYYGIKKPLELTEIYTYSGNLPMMAEGGYMARGGASKSDKEKLANLAYQLQAADEGWIKNNHSEFVKMQNEYKLQWEKVHGDTNYANPNDFANGGYMAGGGKIKDQYEGREAEDIWNNLSKMQRQHFLYDHASEIEDYRGEEFGELKSSEIIKAYNSDYSNLDKNIRNRFENHVRHGQYAKGGKVGFSDKVKAIKQSLLKRKKVSPKVQKDYGKTYSPKEAEASAKRIVGAMTARQRMQKLKKKIKS